jgi:flagellar biosynthesis/type III secretory pathway protein FliH
MILRNAIVSLERHRVDVAFQRVPGVETSAATEAPAAVMDALPPPASLQTAEVIDWLATASDVARVACAATLAPELEALRTKARAHGYSEGVAAATRELESRQTVALSHLATIASQLEIANSRALEDLAQSCASIVGEAFVKLAGEALVTEAAAVGAVRQVLERVCRCRRYTIFVSPGDLQALESARTHLESAIAGVALHFQGEAGLQLGGCRVESEFGIVDASFETQLRALFATLRSARDQSEVAG